MNIHQKKRKEILFCSFVAQKNNQKLIRGNGSFGMARKNNKGELGVLYVYFSCPIVILAHVWRFSLLFLFSHFFEKR